MPHFIFMRITGPRRRAGSRSFLSSLRLNGDKRDRRVFARGRLRHHFHKCFCLHRRRRRRSPHRILLPLPSAVGIVFRLSSEEGEGRMAAASGERDRAPRQTRLESERSLWCHRRRCFTTRVDLFRVCGGRPPHGEHSRVLEEGHASRPIFHVHFLFLTAVMEVGKSS